MSLLSTYTDKDHMTKEAIDYEGYRIPHDIERVYHYW